MAFPRAMANSITITFEPTLEGYNKEVSPAEEDVQIDNQPQNLKKYQMYFKRWVIILTLGVYNLNVQKFFECLQTF